jgi:type II secretory pathway predicted ATPase ExeA
VTLSREVPLDAKSIEASRRRAFSETCDPSAYVPRDATEAALASIRDWGESDEVGSTVAALVGTPGLGKTMLLRVTESRINAGAERFVADGGVLEGRVGRARALYLPYAGLAVPDLAFWVQGLLGLAPTTAANGEESEVAMEALMDLGGGPVDPFFLLIDDADSMPMETVQALLASLPRFDSPLRILIALNPDSKATRLFSALHPLQPTDILLRTRMSEAETGVYLRERMRWAGLPRAEIEAVDDAAATRFHALSAGVPRRIHALASTLIASQVEVRPAAFDEKQRREDWMGRPIEDDLET